MKAEEFDKKFDDGEEDITGLLDLSKARPGGPPMSSGGSMWTFLYG